METPIKLDDLGGKPTIFGNTHIFGFIHFGVPVFHSANCSFLIQSKKHVASAALQTNEQECLDKRLAISYKSTELPILHEINVPYQNDMV